MCLKNKVEVNDELKAEQIIQNFNDDFNIRIKLDNVNLLMNLYYNFLSLQSSDNTSDRTILAELVDVEEKLNNTLNEEQKTLWDNFNDLKDKLFDEEEKRIFLYGYCLNKALEVQIN